MSLEQELLFSVFAVQLGMASSEQLSRAAGAWAVDRSGSLRDRLVEAAGLSEKDARVVADLVGVALRVHGGDAVRTLRSIGGATALTKVVLEGKSPSAKLLSFGGDLEPDELVEPDGADDEEAEDDSLEVTHEQAGRYEDRDEVLGEGGIGRVLLTFDRHLGREVARKELHAREEAGTMGSITGQMLRFVREARVTGQLEHPNIVPVYELGCGADDTLYYTMKIVRGRTLREALADCTDLQARLRLLGPFQRACEALAYAHSRGVVHRDLKPDNIMLGEFGETVVVDWGLAKVAGEDDLRGKEIARDVVKLREADSQHTVEGSAIGTPAYMSPEQAEGDVEAIDERSDTWGLGAILYEILTGAAPFEGAHPFEIIGKVMSESVKSVRTKVPDAPADLAAIADRALRRDRDARYQRAYELAADIAAWESGRNVGVYSYSSWELARRFVRRNPLATGAAVIAALSLVVGSALIYRAYGQAEQARTDAVSEREQARANERRAQTNERMAQDAVTESFLEKAERALSDADPAAAAIFAASALVQDPNNPHGPHFMARTDGTPEEIAERDRRATERIAWAYSLHDQAVGSRTMQFARDLKLGGVGKIGAMAALRAGPDGQRVAWITQSGRVGIHRIDDPEPLRIIEPGSGQGSGEAFLSGSRGVSVVWTPDGTQVAFTEGPVVRFVDAGSGAEVRRVDVRVHASACALSSDGVRLATAHRDGVLRFWSLPEGELIRELTLSDSILGQVIWASASERVLVLAGGTAYVVDAETGDVVVRETMASSALFGWISPDGTHAVATTRGGVAHFFDEDGTRRRHDAGERLHDVDRSDRGLLLIGGSTNHGFIFDFDTLELQERLHGARRDFFRLAWVGDRALAGGQRRVVRVFERKPTFWRSVAVELESRANARAMSADGETMWVASSDGVVSRVALQTGQKAEVAELGVAARRLQLSPDGKHLVAVTLREGVRMFDVDAGYAEHVIQEPLDLPGGGALALSSDGRVVLYGGADGTVGRYDVAKAAHLEPLRGHHAPISAIAATGDLVISASRDGVVRFTPAGGGPVVERAEHEGLVTGLDVSADRKLLASSGRDKVVRIWDLETRTVVHRLVGHGRWVNRVRFSPDGRFLMSGSDDGTARLWDVASWKLLHVYRLSDEAVWLNWSPDSKHVYLDGGSQVLRFRLTVDDRIHDARKLLAAAEGAAGVALTGLELRVPSSGD